MISVVVAFEALLNEIYFYKNQNQNQKIIIITHVEYVVILKKNRYLNKKSNKNNQNNTFELEVVELVELAPLSDKA